MGFMQSDRSSHFPGDLDGEMGGGVGGKTDATASETVCQDPPNELP